MISVKGLLTKRVLSRSSRSRELAGLEKMHRGRKGTSVFGLSTAEKYAGVI